MYWFLPERLIKVCLEVDLDSHKASRDTLHEVGHRKC